MCVQKSQKILECFIQKICECTTRAKIRVNGHIHRYQSSSTAHVLLRSFATSSQTIVFAASLAVTLSYAGEALHFDGELLPLPLKMVLHLQALLLSILSTSAEKQKLLRISSHKMN